MPEKTIKTLFSWRGHFMDENLGPESKMTVLVLHTIAAYMNEHGESAFPSVDTIAKKSRMSRRSVITHLKRAAKEGWIKKRRLGMAGQGWKRHEYLATIPASARKAMFEEEKRYEEPDLDEIPGAEDPAFGEGNEEAAQLYEATFNQALTNHQQIVLAGRIENLSVWGEALETWKLNDWSPRNLAGMLDLYEEKLEERSHDNAQKRDRKPAASGEGNRGDDQGGTERESADDLFEG